MVKNFNVEIADRCGALLSKSRVSARYSRKKMSLAIGVSESTIKAWEAGQGSPTLPAIIEWFSTTGENPLLSIYEFMWPEAFENLDRNSSDDDLRNAMLVYINEVAGSNELSKLHYLIKGEHGSSWKGVLNLFCAHAHTKLDSRTRAADIISASYDMNYRYIDKSKFNGCEPDKDYLDSAVKAAKIATEKKLKGYTLTIHNDDLERVASKLLMKAMADANVKYAYVGKIMDKTERTIRNWEKTTEPSFLDLCKLYNALDLPFWPYLRNVLNEKESIYLDDKDVKNKEALLEYFKSADMDEIRLMCYLIFGGYGSNWLAMLELMYEHVFTTLSQRVISGRAILLSYELDKATRDPKSKAPKVEDYIKPDVEFVDKCIALGTSAAKLGEKSYNVE